MISTQRVRFFPKTHRFGFKRPVYFDIQEDDNKKENEVEDKNEDQNENKDTKENEETEETEDTDETENKKPTEDNKGTEESNKKKETKVQFGDQAQPQQSKLHLLSFSISTDLLSIQESISTPGFDWIHESESKEKLLDDSNFIFDESDLNKEMNDDMDAPPII